MSVDLPEFDLESQKSVPFDGKFLRPSALSTAPNPEMPLLHAVCTRRTSRAYAKERVPKHVFEWLIKYAMHAPTACNEQQWKVVHIDDAAIIKEIYERGGAAFLKKVQHCFLVCYNRQSDNLEWDDHIQSGAAFITTFQLLAHTVGVGSCWVGHLPNKRELQRMLKIHRAYEPIALVTYGYYRSKVNMLPRKHDVERVLMENEFRQEGLNFKKSIRRTTVRTVGRFIYYKIPPALRKRMRHMTVPHEKKFYYETFD
ncbi:nitroreductase family protein [Myxococcota bacterium]|nr:nitroreductase family protein [Myxococcota bacterium]MBU1431245.1 nitroreductase family protein [Myxococcota bacterium]MBU1898066.1 nitroreductase family protein [Myxococcota bacterium]